MTQSEFESPLMPRELADAPDIENVPVAEGLHTITKAVLEVHEELREVRALLADVGEVERLRERIARLSDDSVREAIRVALRDAGHAFTPRPALEDAIARIVAIVADDDAPPHAARPAPQDAPAASGVGVEASEGAMGAQGGAGGLGARIRSKDIGGFEHVRISQAELRALADRADALEHTNAQLRENLRAAEHRLNVLEREQDTLRDAGEYGHEALAIVARDLATAKAQVERVRALHRHGPDHLCTECSFQYPCETYLAASTTPEPVLNAGDEEAGQ